MTGMGILASRVLDRLMRQIQTQAFHMCSGCRVPTGFYCCLIIEPKFVERLKKMLFCGKEFSPFHKVPGLRQCKIRFGSTTTRTKETRSSN